MQKSAQRWYARSNTKHVESNYTKVWHVLWSVYYPLKETSSSATTQLLTDMNILSPNTFIKWSVYQSILYFVWWWLSKTWNFKLWNFGVIALYMFDTNELYAHALATCLSVLMFTLKLSNRTAG